MTYVPGQKDSLIDERQVIGVIPKRGTFVHKQDVSPQEGLDLTKYDVVVYRLSTGERVNFLDCEPSEERSWADVGLPLTAIEYLC